MTQPTISPFLPPRPLKGGFDVYRNQCFRTLRLKNPDASDVQLKRRIKRCWELERPQVREWCRRIIRGYKFNDTTKIPRPSNKFFLYRAFTVALSPRFSDEEPRGADFDTTKPAGVRSKMPQSEKSTIAGAGWKFEPLQVKEHWRLAAMKIVKQHRDKYPDYKYIPTSKERSAQKSKAGRTRKAKPTIVNTSYPPAEEHPPSPSSCSISAIALSSPIADSPDSREYAEDDHHRYDGIPCQPICSFPTSSGSSLDFSLYGRSHSRPMTAFPAAYTYSGTGVSHTAASYASCTTTTAPSTTSISPHAQLPDPHHLPEVEHSHQLEITPSHPISPFWTVGGSAGPSRHAWTHEAPIYPIDDYHIELGSPYLVSSYDSCDTSATLSAPAGSAPAHWLGYQQDTSSGSTAFCLEPPVDSRGDWPGDVLPQSLLARDPFEFDYGSSRLTDILDSPEFPVSSASTFEGYATQSEPYSEASRSLYGDLSAPSIYLAEPAPLILIPDDTGSLSIPDLEFPAYSARCLLSLSS